MSETLGASSPAEPLTPQPQTQPQTQPQHTPTLADSHAAAVNQFQATSKSMQIFALMKAELTSLTSKGDTVTPEDVISGAGKLVSEGLDPQALAGLLADMPQGSQGIQAWLAAHAQTVEKNFAQVSQLHQLAQHQMGVTAIHLLAAHALNAGAGTGAGTTSNPAPTGSNSLGETS